MIGVLPGHRGKGIARELLDAVKEMALQHPSSAGICLSTEDASNVPFYQKFGYNIIAEVDVEDLHSWCMFLPMTSKEK
jgi:GNAT superfamily N-acetyltransferase